MFTAPKGIYTILMCLTALSFSISSAHAQDALPTPTTDAPAQEQEKDDSKTMKTIRWNTSEKAEEPETAAKDAETEKAEAEKAKDEDTPSEDKKDNTADAEIPEEEMTAEQRMWKKYKELAEAGKAKQKQKAKNETYSESEEAESDLTDKSMDEADAEKSEEQAQGMQAILERYKNSQKGKGVMNSRSFGNVK